MTAAPQPPSSSPSAPTPSGPTDSVLSWLRITAVVTTACGLLQALLGMGILGSLGGVFSVHRTIGYATLLAAVAVAVFAVLWMRRSGNKGLMFHALSLPVLAIIQIGVAEMGIVAVHVIVGILFLVAAAALATLAFRKGGKGLAERRTA